MQADYHPINQKRLDIQRARIEACEILIDYIHDDYPWKDQQPLLGELNRIHGVLQDEMDDALTP